MSTTTSVDNSQDVIDSRAVIELIQELESDHDDCGQASSIPNDPEDKCPDRQEHELLAALQKLAEEASGYASDWQYGETLIRDSYFEQYAQELADDVVDGYAKQASHWPFTCIDWERAARELQMDYTAVEFDGVTYWVR